MIIYQTDGTYNGLLTAVFESFEKKQFDIWLCNPVATQVNAFDERIVIETQQYKAGRVLLGLQRLLTADKYRMLYVAFLSEDEKVLNAVFYIMLQLFKNNSSIFNNYGNALVMEFTKAVKQVEREKHRMKAFIRFQKSNDGMFFSVVKPDFNVLPLIASFFKNRFADQKWFIYDEKRKYGLLYDLNTVNEVTLLEYDVNAIASPATIIEIDAQDELYTTLWKEYFKSTNIESRKNIKLQLQHIPRRYRSYLTEMQSILQV